MTPNPDIACAVCHVPMRMDEARAESQYGWSHFGEVWLCHVCTQKSVPKFAILPDGQKYTISRAAQGLVP